MHSAQAPYRELLEKLDDCDNSALEPIIGQWLTAHPTEITWLEALARVQEGAIPTMAIEDSWRLYALSRVSDALIKRIGKDYSRAHHYIMFMTGLGLRRITADYFHPFYHEVVRVTPSTTTDAPTAVTGVLWPGFMCGPLIIARSGVSVTGGTQHIRKDIAETSTLYWCYRRTGRPTEDLSNGWGSNSEWRTAFRRDYCIEGRHYYNVDGDNDPGDPVLGERERLELLRHRCFIVTDRAHAHLFPYGLRDSEPTA